MQRISVVVLAGRKPVLPGSRYEGDAPLPALPLRTPGRDRLGPSGRTGPLASLRREPRQARKGAAAAAGAGAGVRLVRAALLPHSEREFSPPSAGTIPVPPVRGSPGSDFRRVSRPGPGPRAAQRPRNGRSPRRAARMWCDSCPTGVAGPRACRGPRLAPPRARSASHPSSTARSRRSRGPARWYSGRRAR